MSSIWFVIMCLLLFSPSSSLPKGGIINIPHLDKIVHAGMFGIFSLAFLLDAYRNELSSKKGLIFLIAFSLAFGTISELIQFAFIPGREGSIFDFIADLVGFIVAYLFYLMLFNTIVHKYKVLQKLGKGRTK